MISQVTRERTEISAAGGQLYYCFRSHNPYMKNENSWGSPLSHRDHMGERVIAGLRA